MEKTIPKIRESRLVKNKPWTEELTVLRSQVRKQRKRYQQAVGDDRTCQLQIYRNLRNLYKTKIQELKARSWDDWMIEHANCKSIETCETSTKQKYKS
ncbi:hypothetical protein QE152_g30570 [Popillia japonica]|uniref:Uncharacterized protein n=1 Tax=Popillia japonica TaxID=7064 RepID=A0AAW1JDM5_POPJA